MLDKDIIEQLKSIFGNLKSDIVFLLQQSDNAAQSSEMKSFLDDVASTSPHLSVVESNDKAEAPTFEIVKNGQPTGVKFCGIPNGHEFTTLLLAILNSDGQGKNLPDETLASRIKILKGPIDLQTFVSLTCTNCPDVAQALNIIAILLSLIHI